jgi:uncharacterized protein (UPF0218 family)/nanoRNase/pAp phosphatase (c-di-AMP/oligoRNAs hydrolase)
MLDNIKLPNEARDILQEPMGKLISAEELSKYSSEKIIAVGDRVTLTLLEVGISPHVAVVDHHIKHKPISDSERETIDSFGKDIHNVSNPQGWITVDAWGSMEKALSTGGAKLVVDGEEDLISLIALFLSKDEKILYGQPGEGIVIVEPTLENKQKYAELLVATIGRDFIKNLHGPTLIIHHSDADGICAATILLKHLKKLGKKVGAFCSNDPALHADLRRHLEKQEEQNYIFLDLGSEAHDAITELSQSRNILILDHHVIPEDRGFGKSILLNPHIFKVPESLVAPASYLSYIICQDYDWLAAIGITADKGFTACKDFLAGMDKKYKEDFTKIAEMVNASDSLGESDEAVKILVEKDSLKDFLKNPGVLKDYYKKVSTEVQRIYKEHKKKARFYKGQKVLLYEISSELEVRGTISNALQKDYPDHIIIIGEPEGKFYSMSLRTMRDDVNLVSLIKGSIKNLKRAQGGGHTKASGCKVLLKDRNTFIETFIKLAKQA